MNNWTKKWELIKSKINNKRKTLNLKNLIRKMKSKRKRIFKGTIQIFSSWQSLSILNKKRSENKTRQTSCSFSGSG